MIALVPKTQEPKDTGLTPESWIDSLSLDALKLTRKVVIAMADAAQLRRDCDYFPALDAEIERALRVTAHIRDDLRTLRQYLPDIRRMRERIIELEAQLAQAKAVHQ